MVSRGKVGNSQHFPTNLHILLDEAEKGGHAHIVSWHAQGHSFKIHDQEALVPLLAKYFRQTKFKSFLRQLQSYGFHRTTRGCDKGVVSHPYFVRGRRSLCFRMTRKPTGGAAAQEAMTRQLANSSGSLVPPVLLRDTIMPLRKTQSAPIGFNKNPLQGNGIQAGAFSDLSKLKNAAFNFGQGNTMGEVGSNRLQKMSSFTADKVASSFHPPPRRRSQSATSLLYASSNSNHLNNNNNKMNQIRRASDPAILLSSHQREDIEKCAEIDYRAISPTLGERRLPRNGFLLSIQESTSVPNQVPSSQQQQQVSFQVKPDNRQEPLPLHAMHQHEPQGLVHQQVIQVQQTSGQQNTNQVQIHQLQYQHQAQAPQHQVCVQYHSEPDHRTYPQHVTCSKYEVQPPQQLHQGQPLEVNASNQDRSDKVYSQQQVAEKIKQAREDMEKHYREQLYLQQGQQVVYHAAQLVQHQKVCDHSVKHEEEQQQQQQQQQRYHKVPCSNTSSNCASPVQSSMPHPHKTSTMYASVPSSNNFEMSFSTSEFSNNRNGTAPLCAPTSGSESSNAIGNGSSSSFSVAISGPTLHRLPAPSTVVKAMPPTPCVSMNAYSKRSFELQPIDIHNMQSNHHSQELHHQQRVVVPPTQPPEHSIEPVPADSAHDTTIDEGTVDFLLQNGNGGCEEWDMRADEVAEGLEYYGFLNTPVAADTAAEVSSTESSSSCLQQQQQDMDPMPIHHHHHSNPIPLANVPQYNRRQ